MPTSVTWHGLFVLVLNNNENIRMLAGSAQQNQKYSTTTVF